jgi:hypothetical protein
MPDQSDMEDMYLRMFPFRFDVPTIYADESMGGMRLPFVGRAPIGILGRPVAPTGPEPFDAASPRELRRRGVKPEED